jgi:antitoxin ParD1/3/4
MPETHIHITDQMHHWINEQISAGSYHDKEEVVSEALRLLKSRAERDALELAYIRKNIAAGVEQADRGEFSPRDIMDIIADSKAASGNA